MRIEVGDLGSAKVLALLKEHLSGMAEHSPPGNIFALDASSLGAPDISFWTIWDDEASGAELLGCGALKELDKRHGEIKSMRTAHAHLRKGVARAMLDHIIDEAARRGYRRLSLETGSGSAFEPAHTLYRMRGFEFCGPFANYENNPFSRFMTLVLN